MPYIGKSPSAGVRQRYQYTATAGQTTFSGTDLGNLTLNYVDNNFVDVFQNGVLLKGGGTDYTATSGTSVVLATGASVSDVIEIIVYDVFSVGNFFNRTDSDSRYALNEGGVVFNETSADVDFRVESNGNANMLVVNGGDDRVGIGTNSPAEALEVSTTADADYGIKVANDDTQAFVKVQSGGTALYGGNAGVNFVSGGSFATAMTIDATGAITKPLQPAFLVGKSGAQDNVSANTTVTITFDSEIFDQNSDFASNTFTAPVTGRYYLQFRFNLGSTDADSTNFQSQIATSNRTYSFNFDPSAFDKDAGSYTANGSVLTDMDANDTCTFRIYQSGGLDQVDISSSSTVSGFLAC